MGRKATLVQRSVSDLSFPTRSKEKPAHHGPLRRNPPMPPCLGRNEKSLSLDTPHALACEGPALHVFPCAHQRVCLGH